MKAEKFNMLNFKSQRVAPLRAPSRGLNRSREVATRCDVLHSPSCDIAIAVHRECRSSRSQLKSQRVAAPIGPATRCDAAHLRWGVSKLLRCKKNACDVLRCIFQHVGIFAPDFGISQLHILRFSNGFQHHDGVLMLFHLICELKLSVEYFYLPSQQCTSIRVCSIPP